MTTNIRNHLPISETTNKDVSGQKNTRSTRQGIQEGELTKDATIKETKNEVSNIVFAAVKEWGEIYTYHT